MKIIRKDRTTKTVANLRTGDIFMVPDYCSNGGGIGGIRMGRHGWCVRKAWGGFDLGILS